MIDAIFQSTSQALHVSFLIVAADARQDNHFRRTLMRIIESVELPSNRLKAWLEQLRGTSSGTVNFSGLRPDEVRAQCAMVVQCVRDHLPAPEMNVIHARYIPTEVEVLGENRRRFYFSQDRVDAVMGLSTWIQPSFSHIKLQAMDCIVAKAFIEHAKVDISFRDLARSFGENHMVYARAFPKIRARLKGLEDMAIGRLTAHFVATGLVEVDEV